MLNPLSRTRIPSGALPVSRMFRGSFLAAAILAALLLLPGSALAAAPEAGKGEPAAWWVFFADRGEGVPADPVALAASLPPEVWARRAGGPEALPGERDLGVWEPYVRKVAAHGAIRHRSRWLNAVSAELTPQAVTEVSSLPFVTHVRPVAIGSAQGLGPAFDAQGRPLERTLALKGPVVPGPNPYGPSYGQLMEINVPSVHTLGYTGNRVRMMMLDTGFRKDHHAFAHTRLLAERDFVFHDGDTQNEPEDDPYQHYHGTGTWGTAGGFDSGHIVGPGYGATFVLAKTEDVRSETRVEEDNYVAALEWADSLGVILTSASLSYTCFDDGFCYVYPMRDGDHAVISIALDIAAARGITCVNAAGNYGPDSPSLGTPADADSMIAVGAVDSLNYIAYFSSRGPTDDGRTKPEVVARGVDTWWADAGAVDAYGFASGTSLSTPLVGGACALLLEAHPEWGPMALRAALMNTADKHTTPGNDYGWGRINVGAALNYTPVLYPRPFSLLSPADSALVPNFAPVFRWRSSRDPDHGDALSYTLELRDTTPGGPSWSVSAGTDTSLTLSFPLSPSRVYAWNVHTEDAQGHRRTSREDFSFRTPGSSGAVEPVAAAGQPLRLIAGPNPFSSSVSFRLQGLAAEEAGPFAWAVYSAQGTRLAGSQRADAGSPKGGASATWNGRGPDGRPVPAGVYYLEARLGPRAARQVLVRLPDAVAH